jgi:drug/metabolite transporter (DMT)-like permease
LAGIASTYLGRWLVFRSIELVGPSSASGLQSTSPLITAAFGWIFLNEAIGLWGMAGIALGILGLLLMSIGLRPALPLHREPTRHIQSGVATFALLVGLGSASAYSASHIFRAAAVRQWNEPLLGAAIGALAGTLALALGSHRRWRSYVAQVRSHPRAAQAYFAAGALQLVAQALVIASMRFIPASVAALVSMCTPLAVMPLSFLLLRNRERLRPATAWGICITLVGIALVVLFSASRS